MGTLSLGIGFRLFLIAYARLVEAEVGEAEAWASHRYLVAVSLVECSSTAAHILEHHSVALSVGVEVLTTIGDTGEGRVVAHAQVDQLVGVHCHPQRNQGRYEKNLYSLVAGRLWLRVSDEQV